MLLMLLAVSWLCCDTVSNDHKTRLFRDLMRNYDDSLDPPEVANMTMKMAVYLRCATPVDGGLVSIESSTLMVSVGLTTVSAVFSDFVALRQGFSCRLA